MKTVWLCSRLGSEFPPSACDEIAALLDRFSAREVDHFNRDNGRLVERNFDFLPSRFRDRHHFGRPHEGSVDGGSAISVYAPGVEMQRGDAVAPDVRCLGYRPAAPGGRVRER